MSPEPCVSVNHISCNSTESCCVHEGKLMEFKTVIQFTIISSNFVDFYGVLKWLSLKILKWQLSLRLFHFIREAPRCHHHNQFLLSFDLNICKLTCNIIPGQPLCRLPTGRRACRTVAMHTANRSLFPYIKIHIFISLKGYMNSALQNHILWNKHLPQLFHFQFQSNLRKDLFPNDYNRPVVRTWEDAQKRFSGK